MNPEAEPEPSDRTSRRAEFAGDGEVRGKIPWSTVLKRGAALALTATALYALAPQIVDVFASAPRLRSIEPFWFPALLVLETASFAAAWALARLAVPDMSWFTASTAQLAANAASRFLPGGAMVGGALYYRMLSAAGIDPGRAAAALTVNSLISTMVLFALPAVAALGAALSAPVPEGLLPVAIGGAAVFVVLFLVGISMAEFDTPIRLTVRALGAVAGAIGRLFKRPVILTASPVLERRDEILAAVGPRWYAAIGAATANWVLDYLALFTALYAVGARPRLSLVLLAYAASAVLTMIPITPGGLGFVEAGLTATLTLAGIPAADALAATLAYRLVSFWLPIPAGGIAYLLFRRRYGVPDVESSAA